MPGRRDTGKDMDGGMSARLMQAINVAARAHDGQYRKATDIPYVSHPFAVMHLASRQNLPAESAEDILIACLLHDVVEDVPDRYSLEEMVTDFGAKVVELVLCVSKDDSLPTWEARAESYLDKLRGAPYGAVVVSACDKLHNLSSILDDYDRVGERVWERFSRGKSQQQWWYSAVFAVVSHRAPDLKLLAQYRKKLDRLQSL